MTQLLISLVFWHIVSRYWSSRLDVVSLFSIAQQDNIDISVTIFIMMVLNFYNPVEAPCFDAYIIFIKVTVKIWDNL